MKGVAPQRGSVRGGVEDRAGDPSGGGENRSEARGEIESEGARQETENSHRYSNIHN